MRERGGPLNIPRQLSYRHNFLPRCCFRMQRGQATWSDEAGNSNSMTRQIHTESGSAAAGGARQTPTTSSRTCTPQHDEQPHTCNGFRIGLYGWRKRCLYSLILGLMVMVILNLALTLWLLKVMEFSSVSFFQQYSIF